MSKEKNITSGEIEGMYEYISDIILKNSKVINKKEIKVIPANQIEIMQYLKKTYN